MSLSGPPRKVQTPPLADSSQLIANTSYVTQNIANVVGGTPPAGRETLVGLSNAIDSQSFINAIIFG